MGPPFILFRKAVVAQVAIRLIYCPLDDLIRELGADGATKNGGSGRGEPDGKRGDGHAKGIDEGRAANADQGDEACRNEYLKQETERGDDSLEEAQKRGYHSRLGHRVGLSLRGRNYPSEMAGNGALEGEIDEKRYDPHQESGSDDESEEPAPQDQVPHLLCFLLLYGEGPSPFSRPLGWEIRHELQEDVAAEEDENRPDKKYPLHWHGLHKEPYGNTG